MSQVSEINRSLGHSDGMERNKTTIGSKSILVTLPSSVNATQNSEQNLNNSNIIQRSNAELITNSKSMLFSHGRATSLSSQLSRNNRYSAYVYLDIFIFQLLLS